MKVPTKMVEGYVYPVVAQTRNQKALQIFCAMLKGNHVSLVNELDTMDAIKIAYDLADMFAVKAPALDPFHTENP